MGFDIGGILIIPLLMGLVEFAKSVGLTGERAIRAFTFIVGALLFALWRAFPLLPEQAQTIAQIVLWAITGPISAMGWYDLQRAMRPFASAECLTPKDLVDVIKKSQ